MSEVEHFLLRVHRRPPESLEAIHRCEALLQIAFPIDYLAFLQLTNGCDGWVGAAYIVLWGTNELAAMNQAYNVATLAPGLFIIGTDGGGEAYGFDRRSARSPVVQVPFIGMAWEDTLEIAADFSSFLRVMFEGTRRLTPYVPRLTS